MYYSDEYEDDMLNKLIATIDASIAKNGDMPLSLSHLRNLLHTANQSLANSKARDDFQIDMEGCANEIY